MPTCRHPLLRPGRALALLVLAGTATRARAQIRIHCDLPQAVAGQVLVVPAGQACSLRASDPEGRPVEVLWGLQGSLRMNCFRAKGAIGAETVFAARGPWLYQVVADDLGTGARSEPFPIRVLGVLEEPAAPAPAGGAAKAEGTAGGEAKVEGTAGPASQPGSQPESKARPGSGGRQYFEVEEPTTGKPGGACLVS